MILYWDRTSFNVFSPQFSAMMLLPFAGDFSDTVIYLRNAGFSTEQSTKKRFFPQEKREKEDLQGRKGSFSLSAWKFARQEKNFRMRMTPMEATLLWAEAFFRFRISALFSL